MSGGLHGLLAKPRYVNGGWYDTNLNWNQWASDGLKQLCDAATPLEKAAEVLGRSPTSIAHRAVNEGMVLPPEWRTIIRPKRLMQPKPKRLNLSYPFIIRKRTDHSDLLEVNALVPRGMPGREDVCQEIMLAIFEGKLTIGQLRANPSDIRSFVRGFYKTNYEDAGQAISLDMPMKSGRSWHDVLTSEHTL